MASLAVKGLINFAILHNSNMNMYFYNNNKQQQQQ